MMDPLNEAMLAAIQKTLLEKSERLHRKIKFVTSNKMPIRGITGIPVEFIMAVHYEMELRDMALVSLMDMLENLFKDLKGSQLADHIIEALVEGKDAISRNPFLNLTGDSVQEAANLISKECPGWDN